MTKFWAMDFQQYKANLHVLMYSAITQYVATPGLVLGEGLSLPNCNWATDLTIKESQNVIKHWEGILVMGLINW